MLSLKKRHYIICCQIYVINDVEKIANYNQFFLEELFINRFCIEANLHLNEADIVAFSLIKFYKL